MCVLCVYARARARARARTHTHTHIYITKNVKKKHSYKITRIQHSLSIKMISLNVANTPFTKSNLYYISLLQNKARQSVKVNHMSHTQFNQFFNDQCNLVSLHVCVNKTHRQSTNFHQLQSNKQF